MATAPSYPSSQKADARPISFVLMQDGQLVSNGTMTLIVRPEDLARTEPSRATVQQSLGGAWADVFDTGVSAINISGHTGWRGRRALPNVQGGDEPQDGGQLFHALRKDFFLRWHALRAAAEAKGQDPDTVELIFADTLDDITVVVVPAQFELKRNRQRPLLYLYRMQMIVLRDAAESVVTQPVEVNFQTLQVNALTNSSSALDSWLNDLSSDVADLMGPATDTIAALTKTTAAVLDQAKQAVEAGVGIVNAVTAPEIFIAQQVALATRNLAQALVEPLAITETVKSALREVYSSAGEAYCNLTNILDPVSEYLDFDSLNGAFNCSSTTGGRPETAWSGENPFLSMYPASSTAPVTVTASAQTAIGDATQDVTQLAGRSSMELLAMADDIATGVKVS